MCSLGGHWLLASGPTFSRTVDNADAKYVDMGALVGRVTCTANVTIRPMGPMVSLDLSRSYRPTKRRAGHLVGYIEERHIRYEIADLNSERYIYIYCTNAMSFRV